MEYFGVDPAALVMKNIIPAIFALALSHQRDPIFAFGKVDIGSG